MATDAEATAAGFTLPEPYSPIRDGDEAIRTNARATVDLSRATEAKVPGISTLAATALLSKHLVPGKNLLDVTRTYGPDTSWVAGTDDAPAATLNYTAGRAFAITPGQTYTGTKIANYNFFNASGARLAHMTDTDWNSPMTVTAPASAAYLAVSWQTAQAAAAMVEQGPAATSYEPFSVRVADLAPADPFPVHTYIDLWTSHIFDNGRNVWVPGQSNAATTASAAAAAGSTTLTVAATGVMPGVSYVTVPTTATGQTIRVASVSGSTLTLAEPLRHPIASAQRLDPLWQNASHLGQSSNAALPGYAALARLVLEALAATTTTDPVKITLLANSWAVQGSTSFAAQTGVTYPATTLVNAGVGGNNTAALLARFDTDIPADSDIVLLFEHVNDTYQGIPPSVQAANWRALVEKVHALGAWPVVIGPPPLNEYPAETLAQEHATTGRALTSLTTLRLERAVANLQQSSS